jgi:hypothetical protein
MFLEKRKELRGPAKTGLSFEKKIGVYKLSLGS